MNKRLRHLRHDERGMSFVFVGLGFMAFLAATILAVDVGMLLTARTQAQTSADAGALSGATALAYNNFTDHSATGPAVTSAINTAVANQVMGQGPSVTPTDVTFPLDPTTNAYDLVQVTVYRTAARSNAFATLIAGIFGTPTADVQATATAQVMPANAMDCVLPFTIPDKWQENVDSNGNYDGPTWNPSDTFDIAASQGNKANVGAAFANPDVYVPPGPPGAPPTTGFDPVGDRGTKITLKPGSQNNVTPSFYQAWDIGGVTGASAYSTNISGCNTNMTQVGNMMTPETGNMVGPTNQGVDALIALDPNAMWTPSCNCVTGSAFGTSPRVRAIPLYDPAVYAADQHSGKSQPSLQIVGYLGFFIDSVQAGQVTGYITPISGSWQKGGPTLNGGFSKVIMLVQ
jgi:Flp pilus assembly protein TadG